MGLVAELQADDVLLKRKENNDTHTHTRNNTRTHTGTTYYIIIINFNGSLSLSLCGFGGERYSFECCIHSCVSVALDW